MLQRSFMQTDINSVLTGACEAILWQTPTTTQVTVTFQTPTNFATYRVHASSPRQRHVQLRDALVGNEVRAAVR
jgi:hypothetical protein